METLSEILAALEGIHDEVHYGAAVKHPSGKAWDYTVFWRDGTQPNRTGAVDTYAVAVVRENYVPEDELGAVVNAMEAIPGMKLAQSAVEYVYDVKPGSSDVVEMMVVRFTRGRKR